MSKSTVTISHPTDRPNFTVVGIGELTIWFSYTTPIAFGYPGEGRVVRVNDWSNTTGKHMAYVDDGTKAAKAARIPGDEFVRRLNAVADRIGLSFAD